MYVPLAAESEIDFVVIIGEMLKQFNMSWI